jgi:hypothetical protein
MLLYTVFNHVRQTQRCRELPYRCDSADLKRYMSMQIEPLEEAGLRVSHKHLRSEPLDPPVVIRALTEVDDEPVWHCSICNRIESERVWLEPEEAAQNSCRQVFTVTYTVCPVCMNSV